MLFNSFDFLIFFLIFFIVYWAIPSHQLRWQNVFLWLASYLFYGWWDWHYLGLIAIASASSFGAALWMETKPESKKWALWCVSIIHVGMLAYFKYAGFFMSSASATLQAMGFDVDLIVLQIMLPVGISFFTFQSLSYALDVFKGEMKASRHLVEYLAFISFFPQLVAGPIERASHLLPQIETARSFNPDKASLGLQLILWGLIKKMVVADTCAPVVEHIFNHTSESSWLDLWWGAFLFGVQIYCDFSAYSEMAMGLAYLLGFRLMLNFHFPYFATNIKSFWKRWHISLTTWFKDYVFMPLGGSRVGAVQLIFNVSLVFTLSGLWHGANFTFLVWGLYHALLYLVYALWLEKSKFKLPPWLGWLFTFVLVIMGWVFFRASSLSAAFAYMEGMFSFSNGWSFVHGDARLIGVILLLAGVELGARKHRFAMEGLRVFSKPVRWIIYLALLTLWLVYGQFQEVAFIYFDF